MSYSLQLKSIRRGLKLNQAELASMIGVSERMVGGWERGETQISLEHAFRACEALGCTPNDLCGWYIDHPEDRPRSSTGSELSHDETVLLEDYRSCTSTRRKKAAEAVRDQRDLSKEPAADSSQREEGAA